MWNEVFFAEILKMGVWRVHICHPCVTIRNPRWSFKGGLSLFPNQRSDAGSAVLGN